MPKDKYTQGPWTARKASHGPVDIFDPWGRDVVTVYGGGSGSRDANARLIAAAPELLETLKWALDCWDTHNKCGDPMQGPWVADAQSVITKAELPDD